MSAIDSVTLQVPDLSAAEAFYAALGVGDRVQLAEAEAPSSGFRAFTLSLIVAQPGDADLFLSAALAAGATATKPVAKSLWGYGGVFQAPDGAIWKVATSKKKDASEPVREIQELVLLLGASDVGASKRFYSEHGLAVCKSFANKFVQFETGGSPVKLALYGHRGLAKDAGVPPEGEGSHRIVIHGDAAPFTDPDGFAWAPSA